MWQDYRAVDPIRLVLPNGRCEVIYHRRLTAEEALRLYAPRAAQAAASDSSPSSSPLSSSSWPAHHFSPPDGPHGLPFRLSSDTGTEGSMSHRPPWQKQQIRPWHLEQRRQQQQQQQQQQHNCAISRLGRAVSITPELSPGPWGGSPMQQLQQQQQQQQLHSQEHEQQHWQEQTQQERQVAADTTGPRLAISLVEDREVAALLQGQMQQACQEGQRQRQRQRQEQSRERGAAQRAASWKVWRVWVKRQKSIPRACRPLAASKVLQPGRTYRIHYLDVWGREAKPGVRTEDKPLRVQKDTARRPADAPAAEMRGSLEKRGDLKRTTTPPLRLFQPRSCPARAGSAAASGVHDSPCGWRDVPHEEAAGASDADSPHTASSTCLSPFSSSYSTSSRASCSPCKTTACGLSQGSGVQTQCVGGHPGRNDGLERMNWKNWDSDSDEEAAADVALRRLPGKPCDAAAAARGSQQVEGEKRQKHAVEHEQEAVDTACSGGPRSKDADAMLVAADCSGACESRCEDMHDAGPFGGGAASSAPGATADDAVLGGGGGSVKSDGQSESQSDGRGWGDESGDDEDDDDWDDLMWETRVGAMSWGKTGVVCPQRYRAAAVDVDGGMAASAQGDMPLLFQQLQFSGGDNPTTRRACGWTPNLPRIAEAPGLETLCCGGGGDGADTRVGYSGVLTD